MPFKIFSSFLILSGLWMEIANVLEFNFLIVDNFSFSSLGERRSLFERKRYSGFLRSC